MHRIELTPGGPACSRLVAGLWRLREWRMDAVQLADWISACVELGITSFDHADIYGDHDCEARFGDALARRGGRGRLELVSKCGICPVTPSRPGHRVMHYDTSRRHISASVEGSLRALRSDYLDLLLIHRPDPLMDADETAEALVALHQAGKVRHVGVSNFTAPQFELLASRLPFPLATNQIEISLRRSEVLLDGTLDALQRLRVAPMAWSPLGGGALLREGDDPATLRLQAALQAVGDDLDGATPDQVALAWLLRHPARIVPVLGSGKIERLASAARATELELDRQQWFALWEAARGERVP